VSISVLAKVAAGRVAGCGTGMGKIVVDTNADIAEGITAAGAGEVV